jgi:ankyrin repeat protein
MKKLESSRYFSDPQTAAFVDHVQEGDVEAVRAGLKGGVDPNAEGKEGFRPIHFAFFAEKPDVLKVLLGAGADPNAALNKENTPLIFSVRTPDAEFTRALLAAGANPNKAGENGKPPLHEALYQSQPAHIEALATGGADINAVWSGANPTMSAVEIANWEGARILLEHGADLAPKNRQGETAMDLACQAFKRYPANAENKRGVQSLLKAFTQRNASLPCAAEVEKFR